MNGLKLTPAYKYNISEVFGDTIQGEGHLAGYSAVFIRLSFSETKHKMSLDDIFQKIYSLLPGLPGIYLKGFVPPKVFVITGDEPLIHPGFKLILSRLLKDFETSFVCIESNGTHPFPPEFIPKLSHYENGYIWFTVSPKHDSIRLKKKIPYYIHPNNQKKISELKLVIDKRLRDLTDDNLFKFLRNLELKYQDSYLSLSPEWNEKEKNLKKIMRIIKLSPNWRLSIQSHKYLNLK